MLHAVLSGAGYKTGLYTSPHLVSFCERFQINGKPIDESYLPAGTISDCASFVPNCFPSGQLPPNRYWVMGDNRGGSRDSRSFGAIDKSSIVGRVFLRIWPLNRLGIL